MRISLIAKNFTALLGSNFIVQLLRFFTVALLARRLGNDVFGVYSYILLLLSFGAIFIEFGLRNYAIREFAQNRGSRSLIHRIFLIRAALALLGCGALTLLTHLAFPDQKFLVPSLIFAFSLFIDAFTLDFLLVSDAKLTSLAVGNIIQALLLYGAALSLVHTADDFKLLALLYGVSHVAWIGFYALTAISSKTVRVQQAGGETTTHVLRVAWGGVPFLTALLIGTFQYSMDVLLIGQFHLQHFLGDYAAALKILGIPLGVLNAFMAAVQPQIAKETSDLRSARLKNMLIHMTHLVWVLLVPTLLVCWLFGDSLVQWLFGMQYMSVTPGLLKPLSIVFCLFGLGQVPMQALFLSSQVALLVRLSILNCLFSLIVVFSLLILGHSDWVAWAMIAVQAVYAFTAWHSLCLRTIISKEEVRTLLFPALLMGLVFIIPYAGYPVVKLVLATIAYLAGLFLVKVWKRTWFKVLLGGQELQ